MAVTVKLQTFDDQFRLHSGETNATTVVPEDSLIVAQMDLDFCSSKFA
jgi:hypothetical protein